MDLEMLKHPGTWTGDDWVNLFAILAGIALIAGGVWKGFHLGQRLIARLETRLTTHVQSVLQGEAASMLEPMVKVAVTTELEAQREAIAQIARDMALAEATIAGLQENREHLARLHLYVEEVATKAEIGYRYVRYLQHGNTLTKMRIEARGSEWRRQAANVYVLSAGPDRAARETVLFNALVDICEPVIANAVVNESQTLTPAKPGYSGIVDIFATRSGIADRPWSEREQAFHERLTVSCVRRLHDEMKSFLPTPSSEPAPDFYTQIVKVCTFAIFGDIAALQRGDPLP